MLHRPSCVLFVGHPLIFLRAKMKITLFYMDDKLKFTLFFIPSVQNLLTYRRELCDVFFKGKRLCENCHSWRKSPRSRAGSDDALIWYLRFSSRKLLTTFRVPFCQLKLVLVQRKRKSCQEVLSTFVVFYILLMLQTSESFFFSFFPRSRTLWQDTWLVDEFTPALEMIKLLTLCKSFQSLSHPAAWHSENNSVSEACASSCVATCATL